MKYLITGYFLRKIETTISNLMVQGWATILCKE